MKDRIVEHPNRYLLEQVDAAEGIVDLIPFPGYVAEPGTPLNKATLLSDETAAALGLQAAVTLSNLLPDSSFENGGEGWSGPLMDYIGSPGYSNGVLTGKKCLAFDDQYVSSDNIASGGVTGLDIVSGHTYYFSFYARGFTVSSLTYQVALVDEAGGTSATGAIATPGTWTRYSHMLVPSATRAVIDTKTFMFKVTEAYGNAVDDMMLIDLTAAFGAGNEPDKAWCDENIPWFEGSYAFRDGPTVDEALAATSAALKQLGSDLAAGVHIATGSYTGTGTYGASNPNVLSFDFAPDVVFVFAANYSPVQTFVNDSWSSTYVDTVFSFDLIYFFRGGASARVGALSQKDLNGNLGQGATQMPYTMEGNTLSWMYTAQNYGTGNIAPRAQYNVSGGVYHYIAIGRGSAA